MGLFSTDGHSLSTESVDSTNYNFTYDECVYDDLFEGASFAIAESENNFNSIIKAIGISEYNYFEETGRDMIYESADFKAFFNKIKEFFKKIWEKIKGIFQKFFATINKYTMSDKEFVRKYKRQITLVKIKDFTYKGYKFTNLDKKLPSTSSNLDKVEISSVPKDAAELKKITDPLVDDKLDDMLETFRGTTLVGTNSGRIDASEYSKELFMYFRDGSDSKDTLDDTDINVTELFNFIESEKSERKSAETDFKEFKRKTDGYIKEYDRAAKTPLKEIPSTDVNTALVKYYTALSNVQRSHLDILTLWEGAKLKALKDRKAQAKSICVKLLTYKPKNESVDYSDYSESGSLSSALGSVEFK